jgi:hypothetical protein
VILLIILHMIIISGIIWTSYLGYSIIFKDYAKRTYKNNITRFPFYLYASSEKSYAIVLTIWVLISIIGTLTIEILLILKPPTF